MAFSSTQLGTATLRSPQQQQQRNTHHPSSSDEVPMAFDCYSSIGVGATRNNANLDHLQRRLRDIVDGKVPGELRPDKQNLRSHVQDAVQVFAQTIEDEDGLMVCDFMNCLIEKPGKVPPRAAGAMADDSEYEKKKHELFTSKLLSFALLKNEPVCMLGVAMKKLRPNKPRVVVVTPRGEMTAALKALKAAAGGKKNDNNADMLKNLFPALGWVIVPDGTDMPVAKVNLMIALARVLRRHALGVVCSGGLGVLAQMHQSALWDVPMLVLHGTGRISDLWRKLWPKRTSSVFDAFAVHAMLQSVAGYFIEIDSAHMVREVLKKGNLMIHSLENNSNAFERLFRIELNGDQLIETARRRVSSYSRTINVFSRYRSPLSNLAIFVGLLATVASVLVGGIEAFFTGGTGGAPGEAVRLELG